jgi:hypothetical protein
MKVLTDEARHFPVTGGDVEIEKFAFPGIDHLRTGAPRELTSHRIPSNLRLSQPVGSRAPNQLPIGRSAVSDSRATLGMWDDTVRWTSRQAVSNYITPNADLGYLTRSGFGLDNAATSQHLDVSIWKAGSLRVSLFGEYDRVGEFFTAPTFVIKGSDAFFIPNSTATRMGGAVQQGPITFTLEQRTRQSLAQDNAPTNVENKIGVWLSFDDLLGRTGETPGGMSWLLPHLPTSTSAGEG